VEIFALGALLPFLLELVLVKHMKVEVFYDEKGFLLEILFGIKVKFFALLFIIT
jgi:hypothetical protein